jgi:hypothetical protein
VEGGGMDPVISEQLDRDHPLAWHLDDFLTGAHKWQGDSEQVVRRCPVS